jgi:hypothetical protein
LNPEYAANGGSRDRMDKRIPMNRTQLKSRIVALLLTLAIGLNMVPGRALALTRNHPSGGGTAQEYTFQECDSVQEADLRDELNKITQQVFSEERGNLSVADLVDRNWIELGMDSTLDTEIDNAVERVRTEEDYWNRFLSGWSSSKAQEFTAKVTNYAFESENFRTKLDELSLAVADDLSAELATMSALSASSALLCVQAFIGDKYSATMVTLFEQEIQQQVEAVEYEPGDVGITPILESHGRGLAGVGVIIGTQIAKRLAKKIAQRIAGKVLGRIVGKAATSLIPLAGWIIGGGLIVWDLIESGNGSLPQIQEALKREDVKSGMRAEIADTISGELNQELPQMAREVSNDIYSNWLDFKKKYRQVLDLAENDDTFHQILNDTPVDDVYKLANLVALSAQVLGQDELVRTIDSGIFERVFGLPEASFAMLQATGSMESLVAWADLAGSSLESVVELEIYKLKSPEDFSDRQALEAVIALETPDRIAKLLLLDPDAMNELLALPTENLMQLVDSYSNDDLTWLADYVSSLDQEQKNQLVGRLLDDPKVLRELKSEKIKEIVIKSKDVEKTLDVIAPRDRRQSAPVRSFLDDSNDLLNRQIPWQVYWLKYGSVSNLAWLLGGLVVLWLLWRILRRRSSTTQIIINVPGERNPGDPEQ